MFHNFHLFNEAVALTSTLRDKTFYHGCPSPEQGEQMLRDGFIKPGRTANSRVGLAPVAGMVYCTPSIGYAQIYALGGAVAGSTVPLHFYQDAPVGYLASFGGDQLSTVIPDEDIVGELLQALLKNSFDFKYKADYDVDIFRAVEAWNPYHKQEVIDLAVRRLTPRQLDLARNSFYYADASGVGKKLVKFMSDDMMRRFVSAGCSVANEGAIQFDAMYRIEKSRSQELMKDGANFFDVAERIM